MRKNFGIISIGYRPEAPGICTITNATHNPLPICMNVVDSANVMLRYTSDVMAPVSTNSGAFTVCTPSSRSPMVVIVPWAAPMMPSSM